MNKTKYKKVLSNVIILVLLLANFITSIYAYHNISHSCDDEMCSICVIIRENEENSNVLLSTFTKVDIVINKWYCEDDSKIVFDKIIYKNPITLKVKLLN